MRATTLVGLALWLAVTAQGATIRVPADELTIQAGIDAAAGGDTVLVAPGTYIENIRFRRKSIAVVSDAGPAATIIDGSQPSHPDTGTVAIVDGEALLEGFTIRGGTGTLGNIGQDEWAGGGVIIRHRATIKGNWITDNHVRAPLVYGGGGIYTAARGWTITDNRIFSNTCEGTEHDYSEGGGIGIYLANSFDEISGNEIFDNVANYGGGIQTEGVSSTIRYNVIACNSNHGVAGGYDVSHNTIVDNAGYGVRRLYSLDQGNTITHNSGSVQFGCTSVPGICNNFFANTVEDSTCFGPGTQNISVDPLYGETGCGASYCLLPDSPLLPANSPPGCGLIGARGLCPLTTVQEIDAPTSQDYASGPLVARPNPLNPSTTISFRLDRDSVIELDVIDARGRLVARLHQGFLARGRHDIEWDGRDMNGRPTASGAYIVVLRSPVARFSQKLLLVR